MILLAAFLIAQDAPSPPRLISVKVEPYQFPIMLAMTDCLLRADEGPVRDPAEADAVLAAAVTPCKDAILVDIDSGVFRRDGEKLTPRQRRDTIRVLDQTATNVRTSRRHYGEARHGLLEVDPNGPIARGVRVLDPIASHFERYSACVNAGLKSPPYMTTERVERAISACAPLRLELSADADAVLARQSDYANPAKRGAAIAEMFDGFDEIMRALARGEGFRPVPESATE